MDAGIHRESLAEELERKQRSQTSLLGPQEDLASPSRRSGRTDISRWLPRATLKEVITNQLPFSQELPPRGESLVLVFSSSQ